MIRKLFLLFISCLCFHTAWTQTTDLSVSVAAQDLSGVDVPQVHIYQQFQYLVTISNSGGPVNNAIYHQTINSNSTIVSAVSVNATNGATPITDFNVDLGSNEITATINSMPVSSSLQIRVVVIAPTFLGGIATTAIVSPPDSVTDTSPSNNTSIISIDVVDAVIDFTISQQQITPPAGMPINNWNDSITYELNISNNSDISFPLASLKGILQLESTPSYGLPILILTSINCVNATNGNTCFDNLDINAIETEVSAGTDTTAFIAQMNYEFQANSSITLEVVYQFLEPECTDNQGELEVNTMFELGLAHENISSNLSNQIVNTLIEAPLCDGTDVCISSTQLSPDVDTPIVWGQEMEFETTVCNNGPSAADVIVSFRNISDNVNWDIVSIECQSSASTVDCNDINFVDANQYWLTGTFNIEVGDLLVVKTIVVFPEPECIISETTDGRIRSNVSIDSNTLTDLYLPNNNNYSDFEFPEADICDFLDINVSKTQISPNPPEGSTSDNTTAWGAVTYEVTVENVSDIDTNISLVDYISTNPDESNSGGILQSVTCVSTTGSAQCQDITLANLGIPLDGIPDSGMDYDLFWGITPEDDWLLPGLSSITFEVIVEWTPECLPGEIMGGNAVQVEVLNTNVNSEDNISTSTVTYFAPCVDLIVQTFPETAPLVVNQSFNWIIDVTNSTTSSQAKNVFFEDNLDAAFLTNGAISCEVTSGNASCPSSFNISGNNISGIIPSMDAGSTVRITVPVMAPSFGGGFVNTAEATPSAVNNEELTPETNLSISSVQVISPILNKTFSPESIYVDEESILTFTVSSNGLLSGNNNISFIDNLPSGLVLASSPIWVLDNGCTGNFVGNVGEDFVGITNLIMPNGVESCSFSVQVTSSISGIYSNNPSNFSDLNNIDPSQANANLEVLNDTTNVDIEVLKSVNPVQASIGEVVTFLIEVTNLGSTSGTSIEIEDNLPLGYMFISANVSFGTFDEGTMIWEIPILNPYQLETLEIQASIVSGSDLTNVARLFNLLEIDRNDQNNESSATPEVDNCLRIPEVFTPNDDFKNDIFYIPCLEDYGKNTLKIFNRYGTLVYEVEDYSNSWDATPNQGLMHTESKKLPVGTYYYVLEISEFNKPFIGWVYVTY